MCVQETVVSDLLLYHVVSARLYLSHMAHLSHLCVHLVIIYLLLLMLLSSVTSSCTIHQLMRRLQARSKHFST